MTRLLGCALAGAASAAIALILAASIHPGLVLEMDRDIPRFGSGFHEVELRAGESYAWTSGRAQIVLTGADRRHPWECVVRFRSGRPVEAGGPVVSLAIDGIAMASAPATPDNQDLAAIAPARPGRPGLAVAILSSTTFTPGQGDARVLGVQVDRLSCAPIGAGLTMPPSRAVAGAVWGGLVIGAALGVLLLTPIQALTATLVIASAQAIPIASGPAPYGGFPGDATRIAIWIAAVLMLTRGIEAATGRMWHTLARWAVVIAAAMLHVELLGLLHPSKPIIDAVFHAHRLEWVMGGRYFFTQPMPDGVQFPYAIALYVFTLPWTALTRDHVTLLRVIVCACNAAAAVAMCAAVVRVWRDQIAGVASTLLIGCVPLTFVVVGNANLTNAFGAAVGLMAVLAAATLRFDVRTTMSFAIVAVLTAVALLSHVSTCATLLTTLAVLAMLSWRSADRRAALAIVGAALVAGAVSVVIYYGHFLDVYRDLGGLRAAASPPLPGARGPAAMTSRLVGGASLAIADIGWPIAALAAIGAVRLWREGRRDRLTLALIAWGAMYVVFFAVGAAAPVGVQFERYAAEFISRVDYAACPAAAILAGAGVSWAWRKNAAWRAAAIVIVAAATVLAARAWYAWFT